MLDHENRVADIVDRLRAATTGEDIAWSISNALDRMRYGLQSVTDKERDEILRAIAQAHGAALFHLPMLSPVQLALGFGAMAARVIAHRESPPRHAFGSLRDLHDRVRIFQSELDILAREQDIGGRAEARKASACSGNPLQQAPRLSPPVFENHNQRKLTDSNGLSGGATE